MAKAGGLFANATPVAAPATATTAGMKQPADYVKNIVDDIDKWIKSKMWSLSCYGFTMYGPSIPGLLDIHPDELRAEAYVHRHPNGQLMKNYNSTFQTQQHEVLDLRNRLLKCLEIADFSDRRQLEEFVSSWMRSREEAKTGGMRGAGQNPSNFSFASAVNRLQGQTPGQAGSGQAPSLFGPPRPPQADSGMSQNAGLFGAPKSAPTQPEIGQTPSLFGPRPTQAQSGTVQSSGLFGAAKPTPTQSGIGQTSSLFGASKSAATQPGVVQNSSLFGPPKPIPAQSGMGQPSSLFATPTPSQGQSGMGQTASLFGALKTAPAQSAMGQPSSLFGTPKTVSNSGFSFKAAMQGSPAPQSQSLFGTAPSASALPTGSIFAAKPTAVTPKIEPSLQDSTAKEEFESGAFTKLTELTPEQLGLFEAEDFPFMSVPYVPPPRELCRKAS